MIFCSIQVNNAQAPVSKAQIDVLNEYVQFSNESIHGLLIIHRLLENFNQDINKYVDLEGQQINFYSNKDIPFDIFDDPEHWFYEKSPYEWYNTAKVKARVLNASDAKRLFSIATEMKDICAQVNQLRFSLETTINTSDLTIRAELQKVYDLLETGVSLYDEFYALTKTMKSSLEKIYAQSAGLNKEDGELYSVIVSMHDASWNILDALRNKSDENFSTLIENQRMAIGKFVNYQRPSVLSPEYNRRTNSINIQAKELMESSVRFYETATVDPEYKLYGKFYFYHNSDVINKLNRYGNGYVYEANRLYTHLKMPALQLIEVPHYYKVIYPKKLDEVQAIASTDPEITQLPKKLKDRNVIKSGRIIKADTSIFTLKLYDHLIQDNDIVSINFNGDWVLEEYTITSKPVELKLLLNSTGKNYLLLHADTVGKRPPNTVALSYTYKGEKKDLQLKSDLSESEMIEIVLE